MTCQSHRIHSKEASVKKGFKSVFKQVKSMRNLWIVNTTHNHLTHLEVAFTAHPGEFIAYWLQLCVWAGLLKIIALPPSDNVA